MYAMEKKSDSIAYEDKRSGMFKNNQKLDALITELRQLLEPVEVLISEKYSAPILPVVLVIGNSRSGSTMLTQILAANGDFSYPSNLLSRFAYAPAVGAMIQQMLFNKEYAHLDELADLQSTSDFNSQLGKTRGAMGVSEFHHFWRRFIQNYDLGYLDNKSLMEINIRELRCELAALEAIFEKPFMCKGKALQYNIQFFSECMPELFFIHIEREPLYVMQSILLGRRKFYRSETAWLGVKPAEYHRIKNMDVYHQIAAQVFYTDRAIHSELTALPLDRSIYCRYEDLCRNPASFYDRLSAALFSKGCNLSLYNIESKHILNSNVQKLETSELLKLQAAYDNLAALEIDH
jgi:hypothetical protein